mmetsp:Transcript_17589/g.36955  ORF Transcript_17589/g.36955 Transcript_17589/m.36955 type:complete len:342 (+) Transcript_17589:35-1060(+)
MTSSFDQDKCSLTPDTRKKKAALPSLLSNIRNAQAAIGRAADDLHEREMRHLMGSGGSNNLGAPIAHSERSKIKWSNAPSSTGTTHRPSLQRGGASIAATLQNYSMKFGGHWRKRNQKDASGKTYRVSVPQSFIVCVGCLFAGFPMLFLLYMLARQAVFGDEGVTAGTNEHKYEVPSIVNQVANEDQGFLGLEPTIENGGNEEIRIKSELGTSILGEDQPPSQENDFEKGSGLLKVNDVESSDSSNVAEPRLNSNQSEVVDEIGETNSLSEEAVGQNMRVEPISENTVAHESKSQPLVDEQVDEHRKINETFMISNEFDGEGGNLYEDETNEYHNNLRLRP